MKTVRERILEYLSQHPEGADDTELTRELNINYRAQTNQRCRELVQEGVIERRRVGSTLRNFLLAAGRAAKSPPQQEEAPVKPWYWEGHVQGAAVAYLSTHGYVIMRVAHTAARERGKDIIAKGRAGMLWVTTKGYPEGTPRTQASTQAGTWFKEGLFDIIAWRGEDPAAELAMVLPDLARYRALAQKVAWLREATPFSYLWVSEEGSVFVEPTDRLCLVPK